MTREIFLTGTPQTEPEPRELRAGKLEATWDNAALRKVCWDGVEIMRAVLFLVRTPGWGTPEGVLSDLRIEETAGRFTLSVHQHFGEPGEGVGVHLRFTGDESGTLRAVADIRSEVPFDTFRTGLIALHPLDGFAGTDVDVMHAEGADQSHTIPRQLSPGQPLFDIEAITHSPVPGMTVETRFSGDIFEMEDHRQWSDASFKTYNRPIALPLPYTLDPGTPIEQSVTLTVTGSTGGQVPAAPVAVPPIAGQRLPVFALPVDSPDAAREALDHLDALLALAPARLLVRLDGTRDADADLAPIAELAKTLGAEVEMQAILAADSDTAGAAELAALADACKAAGLQVARIAALPKVDEGSFQPGQDRPPHAADTAIAAALADSFPGAAHIGGTPAFFTEFNRKRPDPALWDGLTFSTAPVVHAAEDRSVMETLEALPHILASATDLSGGLPISIGPTGIGMRINPYGPAPTENDPEKREGMAARDPRQRGLFAGAWSVGYLARIAPFAPDRFAFGAPTGPFGLISTPQSYTRAFWDDQPDGALYPLFHAARWIAGAGGAEVVSARTENGVAHIVWQTESGRRALVANLTVDLAPVPGLDVTAPHSVCLDAETLPSLMNIPAPRPSPGLPDNLDAYAILYCEEGAGT